MCYYAVGRFYTSPLSDPVSVTVQDLPQPSLIVSPTVIRETDSVQLRCETTTSVTATQCFFYIEGGLSPHPSTCQTIQPGSQLLYLADQISPAEIKVRCFYTVEMNIPSKHSDTVSLRILGLMTSMSPTETTSGVNVSSTLTTGISQSSTESVNVSSTLTTGISQSSTECSTVVSTVIPGTSQSSTERGQGSTKNKDLDKPFWQAAVGVASGLGVFLVGLTAFCLRRKTNENKSQSLQAHQDDQHLEMGAMSAGVLMESQNDGFYSLIPMVPSTLLPSGSIGENGQLSENDTSGTYHMYSSVPARPAAVAKPNALKSLLH
ncbi:hypothetical protein UPYG_G00165210 [Umbra pygmaea]|uniref:Ig-like domain-containing protein n=1 Tax=Umbra pygmaea TaxID=75934 RepID=A0ABD0WNA0_UMBPY